MTGFVPWKQESISSQVDSAKHRTSARITLGSFSQAFSQARRLSRSLPQVSRFSQASAQVGGEEQPYASADAMTKRKTRRGDLMVQSRPVANRAFGRRSANT